MTLSTDDAKSLAVLLAPELRDRVEVLRHVDTWPAPAGALAYCLHGRHLGVRDELQRQKRWDGRWRSTVVFVAEPSVETLIHEVAHILPSRDPIVDDLAECTPVERDMQLLQLQRWARRVDAADQVPWQGHGHEFIRRGIHLWHRAERLGLDVRPVDLNIAGEAYGLEMDACSYRDSLNVEPYQFFGRPFAEIDAAPLPDMFRERFVSDIATWYRHKLEGQTI